MKVGDLIRFKIAYVEHDDLDLTGAVGIIISDETDKYDVEISRQLFEVMICGRIVGAFDYEIEVLDTVRLDS